MKSLMIHKKLSFVSAVDGEGLDTGHDCYCLGVAPLVHEVSSVANDDEKKGWSD
jgi:hypothetical protein